MNDYIYLDSAAAMPVRAEVLDSFRECMLKYPANPEALHHAGRDAAALVKEAGKEIITALTGDSEYSLAWSSSATEAINMAFMFPSFKNKVILTTDSEHPAFSCAIKRAGFCEIRTVPVFQNGLVNMQVLEDQLTSDVAAVALHHVQNETGAMQDFCEIRRIINRKAPGALLIADTVQSVAKIAIPWDEAEINIAFIGGHKVGAPSGGAVLYNFAGQSSLDSSFRKHLNDLRSSQHRIGRPDTAVCKTLAEAVVYSESAPLCKASYLSKELRAKLAELSSEISQKIILPVPEESASPYIITALIPPFQSEIIVRMLADKGVMVSAGSACEASKSKPSRALTVIAGSEKRARTALRISLSCDSSISDIEHFITALSEVLADY